MRGILASLPSGYELYHNVHLVIGGCYLQNILSKRKFLKKWPRFAIANENLRRNLDGAVA
jgi:hypothetical protein